MSKKNKPLEGEVIKKSGRPRRYDPSMCDIILEVADNGGHVAQMCSAIGVKSKDTFYRWLRDYPEFQEAYEESKLKSQAFYENLLLAGACGKIKGFNFNSVAMIMNNKFSEEYKRGATGGSNTEINIGSINSIEQMNSKQLDEKIADLTRRLGIDSDDEQEG